MHREYGRHQRVAAQLQREIAEILQRDLREPLEGLVTVRRVEVSRDLVHAKIYLGTLGGGEHVREDNAARLHDQMGYIRQLVAGRLRLRNVPELHFIQDEALEKAMEVTALIDRLHPTKPEE